MAIVPRATDKVRWRGVWLDRRSASSLNAAEKLVRKRLNKPLLTFSPSQGGWSFAPASAGVHGRAAAIDLRVGAWDEKTRYAVTRALRDCGWAAWYRTSADGFAPHIHGICVPPPGRGPGGYTTDVRLLPAPGGLAQIVSYDAGRNGLSSNARDRQDYRPKPRVRWSWLQRKAVPR